MQIPTKSGGAAIELVSVDKVDLYKFPMSGTQMFYPFCLP